MVSEARHGVIGAAEGTGEGAEMTGGEGEGAGAGEEVKGEV